MQLDRRIAGDSEITEKERNTYCKNFPENVN